MLSKDEQDTFYRKLGAQIKAARKKEKQKQEVLANHLGFKTRISVVNIEQGIQKVQLHTLLEIAEFLNVQIQELLPPIRESQLDRKTERVMQKELDKLQDKAPNEPKIREFILFSKSKN